MIEVLDNDYKNILTNEYEQNYKKLYLIALSILKNPQNAEDALQEAFLKAYSKMDSLRNPALLSTWITRILMNECYSYYRKNKYNILSIDELSDSDVVYFDNEQWMLFKSISMLKKQEQKVVALRFYYGMSLDSIAKTLSKPLSSIKSLLYRSIEKIKKNWSEIDE